MGSGQAMVVVSSQEHWAHFLLMLHPQTSDLLESKQECHVTVGNRSVSFYHVMLPEKAERTEQTAEKQGKNCTPDHPNGVHNFLLLIRQGFYSTGEKSLMRALVSNFGVEVSSRLAVVSLEDSDVGRTPDHDFLELLDACQGRFCRMTSSTAQDGLDVLLHLLHFMPSEQSHPTESRSNSKSSSRGGGSGRSKDFKMLSHQDLKAEEEEQKFMLQVEQQEQKRAVEMQQLMTKHAKERQQEEEERRSFWLKRKGLKGENVKRSPRARLQQQLSITPDEKKVSIVLLGVSGSGKTSALTLIAQQAAIHRGTGHPPAVWSRPKPTRCCQRTKVMLGEKEEPGQWGRQLVLVDTPELWDEDWREDVELVQDCLALALPGPHVFLLVLQLGRFTQAESHMLGHLQRIFGRDFAERAIVLFVQSYNGLKQQQGTYHIQAPTFHQGPQQGAYDYVHGAHASLQSLVRCCGTRFHQLTIYHGGAGDLSSLQVQELLATVDRLVAAHGGRPHVGKKFSIAVLQKRRQAMKEGGTGVLEGNCLLTDG